MFRKFEAHEGGRRFIIEEDYPDIGWYLYVFDGEQCIADYLQDTLDIIRSQAERDYGVSKESWREIGFV